MADNWDSLFPAPWQQSPPSQGHWESRLQQARNIPPAGLLLGKNLSNSLPVFLTPKLLGTHLELIGATGTGKSFAMEAILKSLILQDAGITLLDPHGDLYDRLLSFCTWLSLRRP